MLIGAIVGIMVAEVVIGKKGKEALQSSWGVLFGSLMGIGLKVALSGVMLFFYVKEMF
jgi:uncharacterized protein YqgC (DUF456 family)